MKVKLFLMLLGSSLMISCNQKEMKISRSDYSVVTEMTDFSPAYIIKNEEGKVEIKKNSLIGNTHWVLSVDRDLTLNEVAPFLHELTEKKHKVGGMHEDTKDIYFVYSDTVHKQNAYVKMPFKKIILEKPPKEEIAKRAYNFFVYSKDSIEGVYSKVWTKEDYLISFDKNMNFETFIYTLIDLEKQKMSENVNSEVYVN